LTHVVYVVVIVTATIAAYYVVILVLELLVDLHPQDFACIRSVLYSLTVIFATYFQFVPKILKAGGAKAAVVKLIADYFPLLLGPAKVSTLVEASSAEIESSIEKAYVEKNQGHLYPAATLDEKSALCREQVSDKQFASDLNGL
jgi:hypothetical protein